MNRFFGIALLTLIIGCLSFIAKEDALYYENTVSSKADVEVQGIQFQAISLDSAKKVAQQTGKLIFIDVYAAWCGPCKMMSNGPFKNEKVGERFNSSFVNLKIDAEKDADGAFVSRAFAVKAYPTLLFVDAKGKLVKSFIGYRSEENLLGMADMMSPE